MADGLCEEGTTESSVLNEKRHSSRADLVVGAEDAVTDVKPSVGSGGGASFTHKDSEKCGAKCGVQRGQGQGQDVCVKEEAPNPAAEAEADAEDGEDTCRKKRCTDRYDSSESSDSGLAVNSDYSSSASSSAQSDITDPGSPFSVSSEDSSAAPSPARSTPPAPAPSPAPCSAPATAPAPASVCPAPKQDNGGVVIAVGGGTWTWGGDTEAPTTASRCNVKRNLENNNSSCSINSNISNKKLKVELAAPTVSCAEAALPCVDTKRECCVKTEDATEIGIALQQSFEPDHRGKITHYYKPKKKLDDKRIPLVKAVTMGFTPFMSAIIANNKGSVMIPNAQPDKVEQIIKREPQVRKMMEIKVNSTFKCPVDFDLRKVSGLLAPSKLPDVVPNEALHTKADPDDKKVISIPSMFKNDTTTEKVKSELAVLATPAKPVALCSRLDEKWTCADSPPSPKSSTPPVIPVPSESRTAASVSTPTKPVSNTTPVDRTISSQSCLGIKEQCDVKETRTGVTTDVIEKVSESVTPEAVISTNGQTEPVSGQLTVNTSTTPSFLAPAPVGPKSPILSVPKSIRFPARSVTKPETETQTEENMVNCMWTDCSLRFDCDSSLLEHLQAEHVSTQKTEKASSFVCHWTGCKVYGRASSSRSWLERHVLSSHGGNKPFRCIVDGCGMRFSSQLMLERHVNWHFRQSESPANNGSAPRRSLDTPPNKLFKRCGKKLRYRRQPWSARQFDFFDAGIMECLQYRLVVQAETMQLDRLPGNNVTLHSKVIAQRVQPDGTQSLLLRWFPTNLVEDEWVLKKDFKSSRTIRLTEYVEEPAEPSSSTDGSVYSTPPSSPISAVSSPSTSSTVESEDEGPSTLAPQLWVLEATATVAADSSVNSKSQQPRKSRRKPLKKAAVT